MSLSLYDASIPGYVLMLRNLATFLDKAETYAAEQGLPLSTFLEAGLGHGMAALPRQIQFASDAAKSGAARLAGVEPPSMPDTETTFLELKERIAKTLAFIRSADKKAIDASADRTITLPLGPSKKGEMKGADYLNHFVLPNFYFHAATAYGLLRHAGLEIGKQDFLAGIPLKVL